MHVVTTRASSLHTRKKLLGKNGDISFIQYRKTEKQIIARPDPEKIRAYAVCLGYFKRIFMSITSCIFAPRRNILSQSVRYSKKHSILTKRLNSWAEPRDVTPSQNPTEREMQGWGMHAPYAPHNASKLQPSFHLVSWMLRGVRRAGSAHAGTCSDAVRLRRRTSVRLTPDELRRARYDLWEKIKLKHGLAPLLWMNKKSNLEASQCCLLYIIPVRVKATRACNKKVVFI